MFSSRIPWTLESNALTRALAQRAHAGQRTLDLTVSNPTTAGFTYDVASVRAALSSPGALAYEPDPRGIPSARAAVAAYYRDAHGVTVAPARVLLTASTSEAYALLFKLLCDPGDRIAVPRPSYPLFELLASLESVAVDAYSLGYDGAWHLDLSALTRALTPRTRAVVVVNPNNPTGSFLKRDELGALRALCNARGLALIADEVFADYGFALDPSRVSTVAGEREALAFALSGLSKVSALPQMKLGWIALAGPDAVCDEAAQRLELIADTYLSVGAPVQHAAPALLASRGAMQAQLRARTAANLAVLRALVTAEPAAGCTVLRAEGGWYAVLRVPCTQSEEQWVLELLERDEVLVQPGYFFDFAGEAYLVLSLLTEPAVFAEGSARIIARARAHAAP